MRRGYVRESKLLPSSALQKRALGDAGIDIADKYGPVYIDRHQKRKPKGDPLPERTECIKRLRKGDTIVVERAAVLGISREDIASALLAIAERGAAVYDIEANVTIKASPELLQAQALISRGVTQLAKGNAKVMRAGRLATGNLGGRKPRYTDREKARAREIWLNQEYDVAQSVELAGMSEATLRRYFGPKGSPLFGRKK